MSCGLYNTPVGFTIDTCTFYWNWTINDTPSILFHVGIAVFYAISVFILKYVVNNTPHYKPSRYLEKFRTIHNISLSLVSGWMVVMLVMELLEQRRLDSFHTMACVNSNNSGTYGFINLIYLLSKIWEWGDTYFLVLTEKPVIFLHFFHHMTTFTMAAVVHNFPVGGFCFINALVHFVMYAHYAHPVKWARPLMTSSQLLQFVTVIVIHSYGYWKSPECFDMKPVLNEWWFCQSVVVGYFVLFCNFFVQVRTAQCTFLNLFYDLFLFSGRLESMSYLG